jgi:DNA-binding Xre family transcriptional regulator
VTGTKEEVKIMNENKDKICDDADSRKKLYKKDILFKSEGHGEKTMIDRAEFEKWAKENGKIIIDPQDKFMNTMKIIELMKERNITVYKLSKMINYDRTNLKKILNEEIKEPTISTVIAIADALEVSIDEIVIRHN